MAEATKLPVKTEKTSQPAPYAWRPFENLRQEIDRLFEDFGIAAWRSPFHRTALDFAPFWTRESSLAASPAVDFAETDGAFEITVELPGMDEKNIEVKYADSTLTIKGEKEEKSDAAGL
jgi:HSP20 family protein